MLLAALLMMSAPAEPVPFEVEPDFRIQVNEVDVPIYCKQNPSELLKLQQLQKLAERDTRPLRAKRKTGKMKPPESSSLFAHELILVSLSFGIATREHAGYLCQHPDWWPKSEPEKPQELSGANT